MIIISDIHGNLKTLEALVAKCPDDKFIISGDLIDRGPDSRKVIEYIQDKGWDVILGNHEDIMTRLDEIVPASSAERDIVP